MIRPAAILLALSASLPALAATRAPERVVLVPFANLGSVNVHARVMTSVALALARRGYEVVAGDAVEEVLEEERIRYVDSIPEGALRRLLRVTGAGGAVLGGYHAVDQAVDQGKETGVGLAARLVAEDGRVLWAGAEVLAASDTPGLFGAGRIDDLNVLVGKATGRVMASFPSSGDRVPVRGPSAGDRTRPRSWGVPGLLRATHRIALLPLRNHSDDRTAPRVAEALLLTRLAQRRDLDVVEPGELREALVAERIPSLRVIGPAQVAKLDRRLKQVYFLRGDVFTAGLGQDARGRSTPELYVSLTLFDAATGKVLWSASHGRTGASYEGLMGHGRQRTAFGLANGVLAEMVAALHEGG